MPRVPMQENILSRKPIYCTCNACDRLIYEDENDRAGYTIVGYCKQCRSNQPQETESHV